MRFIDYTLWEPGGRLRNEDAFGQRLLDTGAGCWVVGDGLGGHGGGDIAAQTAVDAFIQSFVANPTALTEEALSQHFVAAHEAIMQRRASTHDPDYAGMRTTLVALITNGSQAIWGHIGDSRLYALREDKWVAVTSDHSVPQALVNSGEIRPEAIRHHPDRNRLLRDLGGDKPIRPEISTTPWTLQPGDRFLLCTDGFWELITETALQIELSRSRTPTQWLQHAEHRLKIEAQTRYQNRHDNYTATAIFVEADSNPDKDSSHDSQTL